ncbi:MAG TPA: hypothetical protein ENN41_00610 [Sediminispirochaeta sp.]|nr:hypothetical protein [Sediminispirochaeta sp.]
MLFLLSFEREIYRLFYTDNLTGDQVLRTIVQRITEAYPDDGADMESLIEVADSRMYQSKKIKRIRTNLVRRPPSAADLS